MAPEAVGKGVGHHQISSGAQEIYPQNQGQGRPKGGPGADAQHGRADQGVHQHGLGPGPGQGQAGSGDQGQEDPGQPQVNDDHRRPVNLSLRGRRVSQDQRALRPRF